MHTTQKPTNLIHVDEQTGKSIQARREALGISVRKLAERAGVDRSRITAIEEGNPNVRRTTIGSIETALSRLEAEMGMDQESRVTPVGDPADDLIEFEVSGNFGVRAVVKGPVRDLPALQEAVAKIIADMQTGGEANEAD